ncbi:MAG: cytochrome c [Chloroflexota bacterium]
MLQRDTAKGKPSRFALLLCMTMLLLVLAACGNMREQPKLAKPYQSSPNFDVAARELVPEAIPVGHNVDDHMALGLINGELTDEFPMEISRELLERGQERYNIYCTPCHGFAGYGNGVIYEEGYPNPASYHEPELRNQPAGYYVNVIANGKGNMLSYAARVKPEDRWAIAAYIRALQMSQQAQLDALPQEIQDAVAASTEGN